MKNKIKFKPNAMPVLIGSLPLADHVKALDLVLEHTPEIPLWVQLPVFQEEGMLAQFIPGMPGFSRLNTSDDQIQDELVAFYEEYLGVVEDQLELDTSRFAMRADTAAGFFIFLETIPSLEKAPLALKGQVTGPLTFTTALKDQCGMAIFYDQQLRDAAVKLLAQKARWQVRQMKALGSQEVIIFIDEPALAGMGSSEFISISNDDVQTCLQEVITTIHNEGGLSGIHVCANTDWALLLESGVDIINFDAYSYFDRFILYGEHIKSFLKAGGIIAWGIVPTLRPIDIERETTSSLVKKWKEQAAQIEALGIAPDLLLKQSLITPSCGTGSLSLEQATRVLGLTRSVADQLHNQ